jgi:uncharacterized protein (TIGR02421 family)
MTDASRSDGGAPEPRRIAEILERVRAGGRVRRALPGPGRLQLDRNLPFLCVHRIPAERADPGTDRFVTSEAASLVAPAHPGAAGWLGELVESLVRLLAREFGAFLLVEVWTSDDRAATRGGPREWPPDVRIHAPAELVTSETVRILRDHLADLTIAGRPLTVRRSRRDPVAPPGLVPLIPPALARETGARTIGIELRPLFRAAEGAPFYDDIHRALRRGLSHSLRPALYRFVKEHTTHRPPHFHALGRRAVVQAVWQVDRALWEIASSIEFLLLVTPVNGEAEWPRFRDAGCSIEPDFRYRPVAGSMTERKRALWSIPVERVEDPTLAELFEGKRRELDRKLTLLDDRGTRAFLPGSQALYGAVEPELLALARDLFALLPEVAERSGGPVLDAHAFAARARAAIARYAEQDPTFAPRVRISRTVPGLLASKGTLFIASSLKVREERVEATIEHEIGTHLLTHHNGRAQPFLLLRSGLPGYEEIQEGLAVFAEHLAGGLDPARLRTLAARVIAADLLCRGATFAETFRALRDTHGLLPRRAWGVALRCYRGGGLTKDAVYLRGLVRILGLLGRGEDLSLLFSGRISEEQLGIVEELLWRKILVPAPLRPHAFALPGAADRLARARSGVTVRELATEALGR